LAFQVAADQRWSVTVWFGPDASVGDLDTAADVVASLAFDLEAPSGIVSIPWAETDLGLPDGWYGVSGWGGTGTPAQLLLASTRRSTVSGHVTRCDAGLPGCTLRGLVPSEFRATDVFVEVSNYCAINGAREGPPLPAIIEPSLFEFESQYLGEPVMVLRGQAANCLVFTIRYWIGPDAPATATNALVAVLNALHPPPEA
jgi:hypothetical protein